MSGSREAPADTMALTASCRPQKEARESAHSPSCEERGRVRTRSPSNPKSRLISERTFVRRSMSQSVLTRSLTASFMAEIWSILSMLKGFFRRQMRGVFRAALSAFAGHPAESKREIQKGEKSDMQSR